MTIKCSPVFQHFSFAFENRLKILDFELNLWKLSVHYSVWLLSSAQNENVSSMTQRQRLITILLQWMKQCITCQGYSPFKSTPALGDKDICATRKKNSLIYCNMIMSWRKMRKGHCLGIWNSINHDPWRKKWRLSHWACVNETIWVVLGQTMAFWDENLYHF